MRELVTVAEGEMALMRKRLDGCQGNVRVAMHELARRLADLETHVHHGLEDLVYLAGAAGVPDRVERASQGERFDLHDPHDVHTGIAAMHSAALKKTYTRVM